VSQASTVPASAQADLLAVRLDGLRDRVRLLVEQRSADDPDSRDPWRGLRHTAESAGRLLGRKASGPEALPPLAGAAAPAASRLEELALRFGLTPLDVQILLVALAPDLDRAFEACYGAARAQAPYPRGGAGVERGLRPSAPGGQERMPDRAAHDQPESVRQAVPGPRPATQYEESLDNPNTRRGQHADLFVAGRLRRGGRARRPPH
jgi:hypothetical protein